MKGKTILWASAFALAAGAAVPANAAQWWENTSISGKMFYDLTNISQSYYDAAGVKQKGALSSADQNGTGYDIKRFYVGINHKFNDIFSANITTDFLYDKNAGATQIFIKTAFLQAHFNPAFVVRVGAANMPWIPYMEGIYGYRYVENTLVDRTHFANSVDWGAFVLGQFAHGLLSYKIAAVNGNGYKNPTRGQGMDFAGRVSLKWHGVNLAVGGYDGKLGAPQGVTTYHTATRFDAMAAYIDHGMRIGVEYFRANDWKSVRSTTTDSADGYSAFAAYQFMPKWSVFGRYDYVNPKTTGASVKDDYYNVGVQYSPYKMINFALVYKHDQATGGFLSTTNGNIGGIVGPNSNGRGSYSEIGLWGQFLW